jgi:ADP-ribose pyrophosphatase YjhB (NUDIX family)
MNQTQENSRRWYPDHPFAGVGAVVIREGRLLMVKRGQEPNKGKWSIPGGGIELGETIYEAAVRETLEECSVQVEIMRVLDAADNIVRDEDGRIRYHYAIIDLLGRYVSGEAKAQSDAAECRWVALTEIEKLDITEILREMLKKNGII